MAQVHKNDRSMIHKQIEVSSVPPKKRSLKVPMKENKSRREKQKREYLNELFLELDQVLEPDRQSNGKACILSDATRLLRDLIMQVETLRNANAALLNESNYVTMERNELKDDKVALATEVERLQNELEERKQSETMPAWKKGEDAEPPEQPQTMNAMHVEQQPFGSLCFVPNLLSCTETGFVLSPSNPSPNVMKPHARYPTAADSWPLELLSRAQRTAHEALESHISSDGNSVTDREER